MELFARKCDNCGHGMNEGHYYNDSHYFCSTDCLLEHLYHLEECFYTTWDVLSDVLEGEPVYDEKGKSYELKKCPEGTE